MTKLQINLTEERADKIKTLASNRQLDLTIVLENVHDPHNIGAVLRTCDAVGIPKVYLLVTDKRVWKNVELGGKSSAGARKWVDVVIYQDVKACFEDLKQNYDQVLGTHMSKDSISLYDIDLNRSTALVFGNEHEGLSEAALEHIDGNFLIPQYGMVQSLNISVACAVSSYEALRQRSTYRKYDNDELSPAKKVLLEDYKVRHLLKHKGDRVIDPSQS